MSRLTKIADCRVQTSRQLTSYGANEYTATVNYKHELGAVFSLYCLEFYYINNPNHIIKIVIVSVWPYFVCLARSYTQT